jgi:outer membrane protein OmpA-like peptidoglycan-associated protein
MNEGPVRHPTRIPSSWLASLSLVAALMGLAACGGATPPPKELLDAREAYRRASTGPAAELVPDKLHEAKLTLEGAEDAYKENPEADSTRDLAYVAHRNALRVEAQGAAAQATREKEHATKEIEDLRGVVQTKTEGQLAQAREQLAAERERRLEAEKRVKDMSTRLVTLAEVTEEARGLVISIRAKDLFATSQTVLLSQSYGRLNTVSEAIKAQGATTVLVEGHMDSSGSAAKQEALSLQRAESVRDYLVSRGIASEKIRATGIGAARPVADNRSPEGRDRNRRVEIVLPTAK